MGRFACKYYSLYIVSFGCHRAHCDLSDISILWPVLLKKFSFSPLSAAEGGIRTMFASFAVIGGSEVGGCVKDGAYGLVEQGDEAFRVWCDVSNRLAA